MPDPLTLVLLVGWFVLYIILASHSRMLEILEDKLDKISKHLGMEDEDDK